MESNNLVSILYKLSYNSMYDVNLQFYCVTDTLKPAAKHISFIHSRARK